MTLEPLEKQVAGYYDVLLPLMEELQTCRFRVSSELAMQDDIEAALLNGDYRYKREHRLSVRDRVDFLVEAATGPGIAIEAKIKGSRRALADQLARYAEHDQVGAIICVSNVIIPLPESINGKPTFFVSVGRAYL